MGVGGQRHAPAALLRETCSVSIAQDAGCPPWCGRVRKTPPPPGFDPRTVQPTQSRYTNYAIYKYICIQIMGNRYTNHLISESPKYAIQCTEFQH